MISILFYLIIFAIVFLLNTLAKKAKTKHLQKLFVLSSFLILLFVVGLRYKVGTDYDSYLEQFQEIKHTSWGNLLSSRIEIIPAVLFKLVSYISSSGVEIFFVMGFLALYPIYKLNKLFEYKYLPYSVLTYCIMLLPFTMNGMRQGIAMSFALLAFTYLLKKKPVKSCVSFAIALLSHTSALLMLPHLVLYFICSKKNWKFTKPSIIASTVIGIVVLFFLNNFLLSHDFTTYNYILGKINLSNINFFGIIFYLPILLMTMVISKSKEGDKDSNMISESTKSLVYSGIAFDIIGTAATFLSRFALYFTAYEVLLIPALLQKIENKKTRLVIEYAVVIFFVAYFIVQYYVMGRHEIFPYRTWIFEGGSL